ncbi:pentatricopeptide repeat-containing protein At5g16640, mitochondrial-like [Malus sylvestris]|uniref:pentatricopeptide repeat-containing protein At5g16640, mitochondrial-like n=1 Tax=Malus sylvestris TaxID=3752 RepID=UPI0021AC5673|nr:pentatricopeptide repeat-containing protein At5g16640, mitochondrial-like [Malus sylvestris]
MDLSLMPSSYPAPCTLFHSLSPSSSPSPFCRTQYSSKLLFPAALSSSATNPTKIHQKPPKDYIFQSKNENPNPSFDDPASRLQVQDFIDRIRAMPSKKTSEIHGVFEKDGCFQTASEFNSLLMALVIAQEPDIALSLFDEISSALWLVPDSLTFSILIRCYCGKNDLDGARGVLTHMVENGFYPDPATFTILVNAICKRGRLQRAMEVVEVMGRVGLKPTVQIYNCLLKGLCYVGRVEDAYDMLMRIKKDEVKPDIYTFTAVMDGFCKVGRSDEAMELLVEAMETGLIPDAVSFNALFHGYCKEGRPMEGLNVLKKMKEMNCIPDCITYSSLLHGLLKWGKIRNAVRVYEEMVENGFEVEERLMNNLVRGLCRISWKEKDLLEDAHQVFEKMQSGHSGIDASTYGLMIQSLCMGKKMDESLVSLQRMVRTGHSPWIVTFNNVIQGLCVEGKVFEALLVLSIMFEGGRATGRVSYNPVIQELNRQGSFLGACSVYGAALKRGVIPNKKPQQ